MKTIVEPSHKGGNATPFLKWAGGKRQLLNVLLEHVPPFSRYVEPFLGGGALFFALHPQKALLNDLNKELITTYQVVKDDVESLLTELSGYRNGKAFYESIRNLDRKKDFEKLDKVKHAARFLYLNRTCYNGLYRENAKGEFNTPFGHYKTKTLFDEENLRKASLALNKNVLLLSEDFETVLKRTKPGDFVYLDPPYDTWKKDSFTSYQKNGFTQEDQIRLKRAIDRLDRRHIRFLLSNSATPFIRELYQNYPIEIVKAKRPINSNGKGRGEVEEVLISNGKE